MWILHIRGFLFVGYSGINENFVTYSLLIGVIIMSFFIGIEDLAANALIAVLAKEGRRFLTYNEIEEYGARVIQILTGKGEKAVLILSRENTNEMYRNYSDFFEEKEEGNGLGIYLKDGKSADDLIARFRGYLALDVLLAFVDNRSVAALGVSM